MKLKLYIIRDHKANSILLGVSTSKEEMLKTIEKYEPYKHGHEDTTLTIKELEMPGYDINVTPISQVDLKTII